MEGSIFITVSSFLLLSFRFELLKLGRQEPFFMTIAVTNFAKFVFILS